MAELARGSVTDRPWGMTVGALGLRGLTGELVLDAGGKTFRVAFVEGAVVGAHSPLASDAAVRLALTSNLITSTQVADITRRMAAAPERDEVELLAELGRFAPEHAPRLRRRLVAQRAARTFSVERGEFVVDDQITVPVVSGSELDVRAVIYLGARSMLSETQLDAELARFGGWFQLKRDAVADLAQYGFTEDEKPVLQRLVDGTDLHELEAAYPELEARTIRAVTYALASCGACEMRAAQSVQRASPTTPPRRGGETGAPAMQAPPRTGGTAPPVLMAQPRTATPRTSAGTMPPRATSGTMPPQPATSQSGAFPMPRSGTPQPGGRARSATSQPLVARTLRDDSARNQAAGLDRLGIGGVPQASVAHSPSTSTPATSRTASPVMPPTSRTKPPTASPAPVSQRRRAKRDTASTLEVDQLLQHKLPMLERGVDYFTLLGVPQGAGAEEIRQTYFMLARKLHPDRLSAIGIGDATRDAQRLMAQINAAFAVLNDPAKRAAYLSTLARGGEAAVRAEEAQADELAMRVMRAEEAFQQGEMALRREQLQQAISSFQIAVELQPGEAEYQALLAWAKFAAATDKQAIAGVTRKALAQAAEANFDSPTARFYFGRVERMLGREREALAHFYEVLRIKPNHSEAISEARVLEQRIKKR